MKTHQDDMNLVWFLVGDPLEALSHGYPTAGEAFQSYTSKEVGNLEQNVPE